MFASKDLISFVFSNENDIYYGDDLIKRDLNQYLWERLHENYEAVYFLSAEEDSFRVRTYGDLSCSEYVPGKKKLMSLFSSNSEQTEFGGWLQRQLRAKPDATAAFVCPLDDFCSVLSDPKWYPTLAGIAEEKKRTGIFVLTASATAEKSAELLLTSPVFEKLQETAVTDLRGGAQRELYSTLKKRKWDNCVFLNTFPWERVRGLLLHVIMEYPGRCDSCEELDQMTEYLYAYLQDPEFAHTEKLLPEVPIAGYLRYEELFDWLKSERHWARFEARSMVFAQNGKNRNHQESALSHVAVLREPHTYAGRCLKIKLPSWLTMEPETKERAETTLRSIHNRVMVPQNRVENKQIEEITIKFLNQLDAVRNGDGQSYHWLLQSLAFCVEHIYASAEEGRTQRILAVLQKKQDAISVFDQHFVLQRNVSQLQGIAAENSLQSATLEQLKKELRVLEQVKKQYVDLVSAMELELEMPVKTDSIDRILDELKLETDRFGAKETPVWCDEPAVEQQEPEPEKKKEEEFEFILTDDLYNFIPPSH